MAAWTYERWWTLEVGRGDRGNGEIQRIRRGIHWTSSKVV